LFEILSKINGEFEAKYASDVAPNLDIRPDIDGLTFGLDEGTLIRIIMDEKEEYIGRPINVACRLQGAIEPVDINGGFRGLMSNRLYNKLANDLAGLTDHEFQSTERPLKNLSGGAPFGCFRFALPNNRFRITEARYGTPSNKIDVTRRVIERVKHNRLDVVASNDLAGNDPEYGVRKELHIKYMHEGKEINKIFTEDAQVQLP
jgi:hypothetical protein